MSQAFAISSPPLRSARVLLHPAEDIGSALKGGVNVSQRQPINEVFRPLVTKFVRNFGREGATLSDIMRTPTHWSPVERTRFKVVPADCRFGTRPIHKE